MLLILFYLNRCYLKLGHWQESLKGINETSIQTVLQYYHAATEHDTSWYKAWHSWAFMNFETVLFYKQLNISQLSAEALRTNSVSLMKAILRKLSKES